MATKNAFGRSVIAVNAKDRLRQNVETGQNLLKDISVDQIVESPLNEGLSMDDIESLAKSIKENGLLEPIAVYDMKDGTYQIITGHRRCSALKYNGAKSIKCRVFPYEEDPEKRFFQHLDANIQTREKDVRFMLNTYKNARTLLEREMPSDVSEDERLGRIAAFLSMHYEGYSKAQLYRLKSIDKLDPAIQKLGRYKISAMSMYEVHRAGLSPEQQQALAKDITSYMENSADPEGELPLDVFREYLKKAVALANGDVKKERKRRRVPYSEKVDRAKNDILKQLDDANSVDEKLIALTKLDEIIAVLQQKKLEMEEAAKSEK